MTDWAQRIRVERARAGLTQVELAEAAGVPQSTVSRIESGKVAPQTTTVDRLMAAMGADSAPALPRARAHAFEAHTAAHGALVALDVDQLLDDEPEPVDWMVADFVARGGVTMLAGREGSGKSYIAQALAVGVLSGTPVAGIDCQLGRVLIIDAENGPDLIQRRLQLLAGGNLSPDLRAQLRIFDGSIFDIERDADALEAAIIDHEADFVVLDTWKSLWAGSEHNVGQVQRVLKQILMGIAARTHCGILLLHHTTKAGNAYRGTSAIGGAITAVFTFGRIDKDHERKTRRALECQKMRIAAEPPTRWVSIGAGITEADPYYFEED